MKKKFLAMLLTLAMLVSLVPTMAFATEPHTYSDHSDWTEINSFAGLISLFSDGGNGYLTTTIKATSSSIVMENKEVNLCLNGQVLDLDNHYNIKVEGTLNLYDCGTTVHKFGDDDGLWTWNDALTGNDIKHTVTGGVITGGCAYYGGFAEVTGTLNLNGGTIAGCEAWSEDYDKGAGASRLGRGGAIYVFKNGTVNMAGGEITGCTASVAGGAIFNVGELTISDGKITNCSVSGVSDEGVVKAKGGAVYNYGYSSFTMTGGKISGNMLGDVDVDDMRGAGVYAAYNAAITLGGTARIDGNTDGKDKASNLFLYEGTTFGISTDEAPENGMSVSVTTKTAPEEGEAVTISDSCGDVARYFKADRSGEKVVWDEGFLKLVEIPNDCTYNEPIEFEGGNHGLYLDGEEMGKFTFTPVGGGWSIQNSSSEYLAVADGKLVLRESSFAWSYKNGAFSTTAKTTQKTGGHWFGFIYIPGSTKTVTTTYYLSAVKDGAKLSTAFVSAELYDTIADVAHEWGDWINCMNGTHKHQCANCGEWETETHNYDESTHWCTCGAFDPYETDVEFDIDVNEEPTKQLKYVGFFPFGYYKKVQTYTANITADGVGIKVAKVQYQVNDSGKWVTGTRVSSADPIVKLDVKALGSNGEWYTDSWEAAPAMTVGDILDTVDDNGGEAFPTTDYEPPMNMWSDGDDGICYVYEDYETYLFFDDAGLDGSNCEGIYLDTALVKDGNNWKYTNTDTGATVTFNMTEGVLTSITVANEPETPDDYTALNGTYSRKMNVWDVLETFDDDLPDFDTAWKNNNDVKCYYYTTDFCVEFNDLEKTPICISVFSPVTESGDDWTYTLDEGGTVTFNMTSGLLTSITVSGCTGDYESFNGEYPEPQ